jgi:mono/diheme cytochrome c family protein
MKLRQNLIFRKKWNSIFATFISSLAISSCNYRVDKTAGATGPATGPNSKAQISYADVNRAVFQPRCISCHGSEGGVNLETYDSVRSQLSAIERAALRDKSMPKQGSLSQNEIEILQAWISSGAPLVIDKPSTGGGEQPAPTPLPSVEPKFDSIKSKIFSVRCISCHSAQGSAHNVSLETRDDLVNSPRELVIPGNPDESGLILSLERTDDKRMPPPKTGGALSQDEIQVIRSWIQAGANL